MYRIYFNPCLQGRIASRPEIGRCANFFSEIELEMAGKQRQVVWKFLEAFTLVSLLDGGIWLFRQATLQSEEEEKGYEGMPRAI